MGKVIMDDDFSVAPPEAQEFLLNFCTALEEEEDLAATATVECWIKNFAKELR